VRGGLPPGCDVADRVRLAFPPRARRVRGHGDLAPGRGVRRAGFVQLAEDLDVRGTRIFDLQIGLTALDNGAFELWTHDRDFVHIPGRRLRDPLV
jgi:hypothetical protein